MPLRKRTAAHTFWCFFATVLAGFAFIGTATNADDRSANQHVERALTGMGYVTACRKLEAAAAYDMIARAADVAYIQRTWDEWANKPAVSADEAAFARRRQLKVYVAVDLFSYDDFRGHVVLPAGLKGDFRSPEVRNAYLRLIMELAARIKPDYLVPAVEIDLYRSRQPLGYEAFRAFYPEVVRAIKKASPSTMVAVSITCSDRNHKNAIDAEDLAAAGKIAEDFAVFDDMLAISTYPMCFLRPDRIPKDFLLNVASISAKPLFVSETSWPSQGFMVPGAKIPVYFDTNAERQAEFVTRMRECAAYANEHGKRVLAVNFVSLADPPAPAQLLVHVVNPAIAWFGSLSFADNSGKPKPAYVSLVQWTSTNRK